MHLRIDQLLAVRDSRLVDARLLAHLRGCAICQAELRKLNSTRDSLRELPLLDPPDSAWARIQAALASPGRPAIKSTELRVRFVVATAAVAAIAGIALLLGLSGQGDTPALRGATSERSPSVEGDARADLDALIEHSRKLDALLQELPARPSVERVSMAATLDTIEQRVQWLDFQLSYASPDDLDEAQAQRLWHERVELMDSLVKVRYAQTGHASF